MPKKFKTEFLDEFIEKYVKILGAIITENPFGILREFLRRLLSPVIVKKNFDEINTRIIQGIAGRFFEEIEE